MKKKGFTLVELLAVIAILAILVIIALPNVLKMFRNAKEITFVTEVQNLIRSAEDKYVTGSILSGNNTCFDSKTNPLDMSGRNNINYLIKLTNKGKVIEVKVVDEEYQLLIDNESGINKADIGKNYKVETRNKTTDILDCNNSFLVQGEEGTGESDAPYKIQYIEDLVELSKNVEAGETYAGKTFVLSRNLDFKNKDSYKDKENSELYTELTTGTGFTPIGNYTKPFSGTFDGKNHRIDNLYIHNTSDKITQVAFIRVLTNGIVKNLTLSGNVKSDYNADIAGITAYLTNSTIDNCVNEVSIENPEVSTFAVGGLAASGFGNSIIRNSVNKANLTLKGGSRIGGLYGCITSSGGNLLIENSYNEGNITTLKAEFVGGLIGRSSNAKESSVTIKNSYNNGEINVSDKINSIGGIIGILPNDNTLEIENSSNEGKIIINSNSNFLAGGLVGRVEGKVDINNSHNKNTITCNKTDNIGNRIIGGLVGEIANAQTSTITNSSNEKTGLISGGNRTGGLVGNCHAGLTMNNCYNLANISSSDAWESSIHIGGLFGATSGWSIKHEDIVILNSYNKGNINVNINNYRAVAGGLVGNQIQPSTTTTDTGTNTKIINSYNQGSIILNGNTTGELVANGIIQINPKSLTLNNVYNVGSLNSIKSNNIITNNNSNVTTNYKNVYYLNTLSGAKPTDTTNVIGKSESEMKNTTFVNLLNSNKNAIKLTEIDSKLTGYTLCDWKLGSSGYPELDCK